MLNRVCVARRRGPRAVAVHRCGPRPRVQPEYVQPERGALDARRRRPRARFLKGGAWPGPAAAVGPWRMPSAVLGGSRLQ